MFAQDKGVLVPCILLTGQGDLNVDLDAVLEPALTLVNDRWTIGRPFK